MTDGRALSLEPILEFRADGFRDDLDHILYVVCEYIEEVRTSETRVELDFNLKMASRAMRCALQVYGKQLEKEEFHK